MGGIEPETNNIGLTSAGSLPAEIYPESKFNRPQLRPIFKANNLNEANKSGETIMVDGYPDSYEKKMPISTYFRMDDDPDPDLNFPQVMPPVDNPEVDQSVWDKFNYRQYMAGDPTLIGQSSYGGKFGSGLPSYVASPIPQGIYMGRTIDNSSQVLTDFYNPVTGEYYTAPNAGYYVEKGSDWRRGLPTQAYNLPIAS